MEWDLDRSLTIKTPYIELVYPHQICANQLLEEIGGMGRGDIQKGHQKAN